MKEIIFHSNEQPNQFLHEWSTFISSREHLRSVHNCANPRIKGLICARSILLTLLSLIWTAFPGTFRLRLDRSFKLELSLRLDRLNLIGKVVSRAIVALPSIDVTSLSSKTTVCSPSYPWMSHMDIHSKLKT